MSEEENVINVEEEPEDTDVVLISLADTALAHLAVLIRQYGGTPKFSTMAEFEKWSEVHQK